MSDFSFPPASDSSGMPWPAGIYQVRLHSVEPDDRPSRFGDTPRAAWRFGVERIIRLAPVADQAKRAENRTKAQTALANNDDLLAWTNVSMNRRSTMRAWVEALLGQTITAGAVVNPKAVIGRMAEATLETYTGEDGTEKVKLASLAPLVDDDETTPAKPASVGAATDDESLPF